ncbi:hypothetical protein D187_010382 [Cystobacter fuscus DSM 2262]|uniref:DUF2127 domain-containing protein n=1 Tax=Cystobacter fuscus (strain ATCC 25194 / DSM 2262 / NBRC 100088 / M29) TaxID=1242864 RepID=S9QYL4_CYSF2|nr:DUF2127 domain-containing protein [Cystobacter fuscus]EPX61763.1 hypothetical protein D187_010382 [Cystobacter fuscus DSM 2262]
MRLIIAYKFVKAVLMIGLALWFTVDPEAAYSFGQHVAYELVEARPLLVRIGNWLHGHLTEQVIERSALVAWLDGTTTALEGLLLLLGKPWGEWLVTINLSLFLPFEVYELIHKPGVGKAIVLLLNAAIVVYLLYARLLPVHRARSGRTPPAG